MNIRILITTISTSLFLLINIACAQKNHFANEKIWLTQPGDTTKNWESQVFHLGNGYFGASCYGGIQQEIFTLGEKTFWTGGPGDSVTNDYGIIPNKDPFAIDKMKQFTTIGKVKKSDKLMTKEFNSKIEGIGGLSSIGKLRINFDDHAGKVSNYNRTLDLKNSIVIIKYELNGVNYKREYFCSYPDRVLAIRLTSDKPNTIDFDLGLDLMHTKRNPQITVAPENGMLEVYGNMDDNNRPYSVKIKVISEDGQLSSNNNLLEVENASTVTIYYTVATNYRLEAPLYKGEDAEAITTDVITNVSALGFDKLLNIHVTDYQKLYGRTNLSLENKALDRLKLPTNERLNFYIQKNDYQDLGLKELAFNLGKYILISASRPGALSAGLQGAWNDRYMAQWNGTNQLDMNVTQTYMFGNALNLSECQEPFIDFVRNRAVVGKEMAKVYYNSNGWTSFMIADIWGHTGLISYLNYKFVSSSWLSLIIWEQYAFDKNEAYLMSIYPVLKGASQFYLENLVEYKKAKKLVFVTGISGEHISAIGATTPNYQDIALMSELFENTIKASEILDTDKKFRAQLLETKNRLMPYKIGRFGQFQEWVEDIDDPNCQHRHISHLLALQPCKQINPYKQPELAEAIKVSLNYRGDADFNALNGVNGNSMEYPTKCTHEDFHFDNYTSQVWCRAARLCTWLRIFDGDRADKIYNDIFRESTLENMIQYETKAHYEDSTSTPFFLDGTVLSAGYVTEMVLQSQHGELDLLPALPSTWETGSITGIRARGGFTIDIKWNEGNLIEAKITADNSSTCNIRYKNKVQEVFIEKSKPFIYSSLRK